VITDVALDAYTSHGHDGLLNDKGEVDNDQTLKAIALHALLQAQAGAQIIAPTDMMDGRVAAIRQILDEQGFHHVTILSYSAKYASALYGPFREALQSASCLGQAHKLTYHMDPRNSSEALREVALDTFEHADMVMIKPGTLYLDVLWRVSQAFSLPVFAFHVSGEYSMLKAASLQGWISYEKALIETLLAFKRAGARGILTYGALDAAKLLKEYA
jgi:porphobilinogen synthase